MDVNVAGLHKSSLKTEVRLMVERSGGCYCWVPAFLAPSGKQSWACGSRDEGLHAGRALDGWMQCSLSELCQCSMHLETSGDAGHTCCPGNFKYLLSQNRSIFCDEGIA